MLGGLYTIYNVQFLNLKENNQRRIIGRLIIISAMINEQLICFKYQLRAYNDNTKANKFIQTVLLSSSSDIEYINVININ